MQKIHKLLSLIIIALLFSIVYSCGKDETVDIPKIKFVNPLHNMSFNVGDTIVVKVSIESKSSISSVRYSIVDVDSKPITTKNSDVKYLANEDIYEGEIIISDKYLPSGHYKLICVTYNKIQRKQADIPLIIVGLKKELLEIAVVVKEGATTKVKSLQSNLQGTLTDKFSMQTSPVFSVYLPFHNLFTLSANVIGDLNVWDYKTQQYVMGIQGQPNPPFPYFTGVASVDKHLAVMFYSEKIELYNTEGNIISNLNMHNGYYANKMKNVGDYYAIIEKSKFTNNDFISFRYKNTGSVYSAFHWGNNVIDVFPFGNNAALVFLNDNTKAVIGKYIFSESGYSEPVQFNGGKIKKVCQIDKFNYVFITDDNMYWYQYQTSSITAFASPNTYSDISYDIVNQNIYAISGNTIFIYSFPFGNLQSSRMLNNDVLDIHLIYNM